MRITREEFRAKPASHWLDVSRREEVIVTDGGVDRFSVSTPQMPRKEENMTSRDFAYWLQGFFEVSDAKSIDEKQTEAIKRHLALVFKHDIDPSAGPQKHQEELNDIHKPPRLIGGVGPGGEVFRC